MRSPESLTQIEDCLAYVAGSTARVVVIRRATTDARNIGTEVAKLPSQAQPQENAWQRWQPLGHRVFNRLTTLPQPTIAVVNGLALGCGLDLALACDHRFAGPAVRVGPTATGLGIIPGWGGTGWLTKIIGSEHVQALIAANGQLDATTAASWGLLTSVVPADALESKAYGYAQTLAEDNEPAQR